ncbi:hypothetical protein [Sporomusa acidovorans]|uniref:Uncharacterized protein n=1 Tax=Sporomusa acidovorans (strain ATCC 49682 / DSM 3132 / Mol) TaxID=1123286 RepID=A0ABZ3IZ98_SPOA4|nr:hypothetical protein [Sporomusa acidovorans]OZC17252.1 hypothetical protein SPACI_39020 [Sporomusa acidovorans DSM 3132]SDF15796.1 hypothetical protein SAMN04488499_103535 [Sporomusa acidovorans]
MSRKKWSKPCVAELDILRTGLILGNGLTNDAIAAWLLSLIDGGGHHHSKSNPVES